MCLRMPSLDHFFRCSCCNNFTQGQTPVGIAARKGRTEIAKLLIDTKADVNQPDKEVLLSICSAFVSDTLY